MSRPVALVTAPLRGPALDELREIAEVVFDPWIEYQPIKLHGPEDLAARLTELGATIVICEADFCMGEVLDLPLKVIGSTRGDPTNVDVAAATAAGIPVIHTPGRNADAVAEMTVALLMALGRHVVPGHRDMTEGTVHGESLPYQRYRAWQVAGQTAGLVGLGAVGRATKWRLEGLGMKVIAADPFADDATHDLDDLLAESDVISMHAAVTPETFGMMNEPKFALMKPGAVYINSARAGLHDVDALVAALDAGHLGGAALDHVDGESLPEGHPLLGRNNVVLTPHIGGATYDVELRQSEMIVADVKAILAGEAPVRCKNPEVFA
ncbi:MAG: NAD(P)-dependent oxidoreductase [Acidimicrobiales bacterium]|jgi:D-3-phosphoglycerate dehydrogenase|nr:NAD(P)-dependent oxidoreductase [Acidimicrobiales bacterium]